MREQVCIILNERESTKHSAAASLSEQLKKISITASRLEISEKIIEIVCLRAPKVLVLDYLLGDYTTGLDIVYAVKKLEKTKIPHIFFLTDEPSVQVAVEAMQLGARNYFQLDRNDSISKLANEIQEVLESSSDHSPLPEKEFVSFSSIIAQSKKSHEALSQAKTVIKKDAGAVIICGEAGSGRSTWAQALHSEKSPGSLVTTVDVKFFDQDVSAFSRMTECNFSPNLPCPGLILENIEEDNGEILNYFAKLYKAGSAKSLPGFLALTSHDKETVKNWQSMLPAELIELHPLQSCKDDIAPLVQNFIHAAEVLAESKIKKITPETIHKIVDMEWLGNVKQLKSVVIDSAIESLHSNRDILEILELKRLKWLEYKHSAEPFSMDSFAAARALEMSNHNFRIAAAKLGCSVHALYSVIHGGA